MHEKPLGRSLLLVGLNPSLGQPRVNRCTPIFPAHSFTEIKHFADAALCRSLFMGIKALAHYYKYCYH